MIELPELVIWWIFEHLSYEDLLNLRVTCKKLREIVDQRSFRSLHLLAKAYPFKHKLFHAGEIIDHANTYRVSKSDILKSIKFKNQFNELLKLIIYHPIRLIWFGWECVTVNDLNCFDKLVHLEIKNMVIRNTNYEKLSLSNLRIALFERKYQSEEYSLFELDCPRLKVLGLGLGNQPRLTQETNDSIEHLSVHSGWRGNAYLINLYPNLKNLSTLCLRDYLAPNEPLNHLALALIERRVSLPFLKQIRLKGFMVSEALWNTLTLIKSSSKTNHIELLFNWKVIGLDELTEMQALIFEIFPRNYNLETVDSLFYKLLDENENRIRRPNETWMLDYLVPGVRGLRLKSDKQVTLSKQLIKKFGKLRFLKIERSIALDEHFFGCILNQCQTITYLCIKSASLKQQQLDRMPDYFQKLQRLKFKSDFSLDKFNLDFVAKFKNLSLLKFKFNIKKETMLFLLKNCNYQPSFQLQLRGIERTSIFGNRNERGRFEMLRSTIDMRNWHFEAIKFEFDGIENAIEYYYEYNLYDTPLSNSSSRLDRELKAMKE